MKAEKKKAILLEVTAIGAIALVLTLTMAGTVAASPGTPYYVNATGGFGSIVQSPKLKRACR